MKTIKEAAEIYTESEIDEYQCAGHEGFLAGVEFAQRWIDVEEELPETPIEEDGIFYSEYLNVKVKGYNHPFVGYYVKANDDEFFDFIFESVQKEIKQSEITYFRPI